MADYADDHSWETFGLGKVQKTAVEGWQKITGEDKKPNSAQARVATRAREVEKDVKSGLRDAENRAKQLARDAERKVDSAVSKTKAEASSAAQKLSTAASRAAEKTESEAAKAQNSAEKQLGRSREKAETLTDRAVTVTTNAKDRAFALATSAKDAVVDAVPDVPFNFSDGVEGIVREAERALAKGEASVEHAAERVVGAVETTPGPRRFLDAQRPRELRPETVQPKRPTFEGKELYTGPALPLGFEPPPGYYIAPPPAPKSPDQKIKETLPLLVPKVKEFAASEPIISQLASTIDSLTQSLSTPTSGSVDGILTKAHDDLSALNQRLDTVKREEKQKLEKTLAEKAEEFQNVLRSKEEEREQGEQGLKQGWDTERRKMVDEWRGALETELESQRQGIEQR